MAAPQQVGGVWVAFLTVYGRAENEVVRFKAFDASAGTCRGRRDADVCHQRRPRHASSPEILATQGGQGARRAEDPRVWTVVPSTFEQSMNAVAEVRVGGALASAAGTRMAAFVGGEVRGVGAVPSGGSAGAAVVYLTVHGRPGDGSRELQRVRRRHRTGLRGRADAPSRPTASTGSPARRSSSTPRRSRRACSSTPATRTATGA